MNPKIFIGLLTGIPLLIVIYVFYTFGVHNDWQLFLLLYMILWCIMPSLIIMLSLDLFGFKTKIKSWLNRIGHRHTT